MPDNGFTLKPKYIARSKTYISSIMVAVFYFTFYCELFFFFLTPVGIGYVKKRIFTLSRRKWREDIEKVMCI